MLTKEQLAIINSKGDIKINAVAGSGKTTTLLEYAKARPDKKILYLAFNKAVKLEAEKKFAAQGLSHVKIDTAHSLAFSRIVARSNYTIKHEGYKVSEIVEILELNNFTGKHTEFILATHIAALVAFFCNSDKQKVQELPYEDVVSDPAAKEFVHSYQAVILQQTRLFLDKMNKAEIPIIHDFYLKKFQLSKPALPYDVILFDEGQDASGAMLDIFLSQKATKVIVGDHHQQIYGWRYAVNSLEKVNYPTYHLSASFRFDQETAQLAKEVVQWKRHIHKPHGITIVGMARPLKKVQSRAVIARTNAGLLVEAIEMLIQKKEIKSVYFEGRIENYTYASDGASIYDVLNLYTGEKDRIRDKMIASMNNMDELEEYIDNTADVQLRTLVGVVKEYGKNITGYIKQLKENHLTHDDKDKADMIFSTVHRSKGMEYDEVTLAADFITEERLQQLMQSPDTVNTEKLNEEINLLYVAITRTKGDLNIPEELFPKMAAPKESSPTANAPAQVPSRVTVKSTPKSYTYQTAREKEKGSKNNFATWKNSDDIKLLRLFEEGTSVRELARIFNRTEGAITLRIRKLHIS